MAKAKLPEFPDINELWEQLDIDKVHEEIHDDKMPDFELRDARLLTTRACEVWLPRDVVDFSVDEVEARFEENYKGWNVKGIKDLGGTFNGTIPVLSEYKDKRFILDWKTTKNRFTTEWKDRLLDSWQWKLYTAYNPTDVFIFRGINRYGDTKEVMQAVPTWTIEGMPVSEWEVKRQLDRLIVQLEAYQEDEGPWLRNMPGSCYAYRKKCPYYDQSCEACDFPLWTFGEGNKPSISYSLMNDYMLCQERLRRRLHEQSLAGGHIDDAGIDARFGQAIHRGLAEIYTQIFDIPREEKHATSTDTEEEDGGGEADS